MENIEGIIQVLNGVDKVGLGILAGVVLCIVLLSLMKKDRKREDREREDLNSKLKLRNEELEKTKESIMFFRENFQSIIKDLELLRSKQKEIVKTDRDLEKLVLKVVANTDKSSELSEKAIKYNIENINRHSDILSELIDVINTLDNHIAVLNSSVNNTDTSVEELLKSIDKYNRTVEDKLNESMKTINENSEELKELIDLVENFDKTVDDLFK